MSTTGRRTIGSFLMPREVNRWVRVMAWASLIANGLLIVTGGAVRLTGSGLGCPTWPRCTAESWTNTPEMGVHGMIEFGNRLLTFLLAVIAILTFLAVWRLRHRFAHFMWMALALGLGIVAQAVIGGITVRTGLNPWVVGIHFILSTVLIAIAAVLVNRTRRVSLPDVAHAERPGQLTGSDRTWARALGIVIAVTGAAAIYLGTLVTGTGPHSGDAGEVLRHSFDPYLAVRAHALPVYVLVLATMGGLAAAIVRRWPPALQRILGLLAALLVIQAGIGYYQWFNGVPIIPVAMHLAGAAALAAVIAMAAEKLYAVSAHPGAHDDVPNLASSEYSRV